MGNEVGYVVFTVFLPPKLGGKSLHKSLYKSESIIVC